MSGNLSLAEASAALGVSRATLSRLIRSGQLAFIPWGRGKRIAQAEIERLKHEGWTSCQSAPVRHASPSSAAAGISSMGRAVARLNQTGTIGRAGGLTWEARNVTYGGARNYLRAD